RVLLVKIRRPRENDLAWVGGQVNICRYTFLEIRLCRIGETAINRRGSEGEVLSCRSAVRYKHRSDRTGDEPWSTGCNARIRASRDVGKRIKAIVIGCRSPTTKCNRRTANRIATRTSGDRALHRPTISDHGTLRVLQRADTTKVVQSVDRVVLVRVPGRPTVCIERDRCVVTPAVAA